MMNDNPETFLHSAKAIKEYHEKKTRDKREMEMSSHKATEQASIQIELLKEQNEISKKALADANTRFEQERAWRESNNTDIVEAKPSFMGFSANLNEIWRRFRKWRSKK